MKIGTIRYANHTYFVWQEGEYYAITMADIKPVHYAYSNLGAMIERKFGREDLELVLEQEFL